MYNGIDNNYTSLSVKNIDWGLFIYFAGMFCLYTNTILQLLLQVFLIAYVLYDLVKIRGHFLIKKDALKNVVLYAFWLGALTLLAYKSKAWAYGNYPESKTLITLFRAYIMGTCLVLYINSKERLFKALRSLIYAAVILGILALLTTPVSQYGRAGDEGFGVRIGQHRNQVGMLAATMSFLCFYLGHIGALKNEKKYLLFFLVLLVCTGSRGSMIQCIVAFCLYLLTQKNVSKRIKGVISGIFVLGVLYFVVLAVPFLNEMIYKRFITMFQAVLGTGQSDSSAYGRGLMRVLAFKMFMNKPILGYGLDGFVTYFGDHRVIEGKSFGAAAYSHCNFAELAADFGIVGLIIWYWLIIYIIMKSWKSHKKNEHAHMIFCLIVSLVILDYARINWTTHLSIYIFTIVFCMNQILVDKKGSDTIAEFEEEYII